MPLCDLGHTRRRLPHATTLLPSFTFDDAAFQQGRRQCTADMPHSALADYVAAAVVVMAVAFGPVVVWLLGL